MIPSGRKFGRYVITERGEVYSLLRFRALAGVVKRGRRQVFIREADDQPARWYKVNNLVARLYVARGPEEGPVVIPKDGNSLNSNYTNLKWGSLF